MGLEEHLAASLQAVAAAEAEHGVESAELLLPLKQLGAIYNALGKHKSVSILHSWCSPECRAVGRCGGAVRCGAVRCCCGAVQCGDIAGTVWAVCQGQERD
jgi:hypothetical protein